MVLGLPTDIASLKKMGIHEWRDDFFWPVSDRDFFGIADTTYDAFDRELSSLEKSDAVLSDILLADTAFLDSVIQSAHMMVAQARAEKSSREVAAESFLKDRTDTAGAVKTLKKQLQKPHLPRRLLVRSAKRVLFNRHNPTLRHIAAMTGSANAWMLGSFAPLHSAYVSAFGLKIDAPYVASLIGSIDAHAPCPKTLAQAAGRILDDISERLSKTFDDIVDLRAFAAPWCARLGFLAAGMQNVQRLKPPPLVMLGEISKPWSKLVALGLKHRGAKIVGANHGNFVGQMSLPGSAWHSHAHCDEVLCYSDSNATLLKRDYNATSIGKRRPVHFSKPPGQPILAKTAASIRQQRGTRRQQTIMIIGYPMNSQRYSWSAGDYYLFQLDIELRLAALLRKAGFRTIYKMHPDRQVEARGVFENLVDEIIIERFEDVWTKADAFVFGNIMTTVFNIAAMTDRPIVALDPEGYRWMPGMRDAIGKRVQLIPATFDQRNRMQFNETELLSGLSNFEKSADCSYIDTFLLDKPKPYGGLA